MDQSNRIDTIRAQLKPREMADKVQVQPEDTYLIVVYSLLAEVTLRLPATTK